MSGRILTRAALLRVLLGAATAAAGVASCTRASAAAPQVWHARGTLRGFGPSRGYVNIAHEEIPGYMGAMTMSFEPQKPSQLDGLAVGDRIAFDFFESEDARRILTRIEKQP